MKYEVIKADNIFDNIYIYIYIYITNEINYFKHLFNYKKLFMNQISLLSSV